MPRQKDLKRIVRARMQKTGESYTAARLHLVRKTETPLPDYAALAGMSDAPVKKQTGRDWAQWVKVLDAAHAAEKPHREIAKYVSSLGVGDWWTQTVTVGYERIRGLRQRGQRRDGAFEASKSRTFDVPVAVLFDAFADAQTRRGWLPEQIAVRSANRPKRMRIAWHDATTVQVEFAAKSPRKSSVAIQHQKLPDRAAAEAAKQTWASRFERLRDMLAAG
jgi:uncharacterized protein YndB with AHSA1/START domain